MELAVAFIFGAFFGSVVTIVSRFADNRRNAKQDAGGFDVRQ